MLFIRCHRVDMENINLLKSVVLTCELFQKWSFCQNNLFGGTTACFLKLMVRKSSPSPLDQYPRPQSSKSKLQNLKKMWIPSKDRLRNNRLRVAEEQRKFTLRHFPTHTVPVCEIIRLQAEVVCVLRGSRCDLVGCVMGWRSQETQRQPAYREGYYGE